MKVIFVIWCILGLKLHSTVYSGLNYSNYRQNYEQDFLMFDDDDTRKQQVFNMLMNTPAGKTIGSVGGFSCMMDRKNEPWALTSNPNYNYKITCGSDNRGANSVLFEIVVKRAFIGGNVDQFLIRSDKQFHPEHVWEWRGLIRRALSGNNGMSLKSQENKWKNKRLNRAKNIALGVLAVGAVAGVAYGGYKIHRNIQATSLEEGVASAEAEKKIAQSKYEKLQAQVKTAEAEKKIAQSKYEKLQAQVKTADLWTEAMGLAQKNQ